MESAFDPVYGEAWSLAQLLTLFALPSARIVVAWDGDAPCGFSAARIAGPASELLLLAVDPARRGRGIGGRLLAEWRDWAVAEGTPAKSEEPKSELQSLMRTPYAVFRLKKKK